MTPEERDKYILDLFVHPGWKVFKQEMEEAHEQLLRTCCVVKDERELYKRKGELQKLSELLAFEDVTKFQMTQNSSDDEDF